MDIRFTDKAAHAHAGLAEHARTRLQLRLLHHSERVAHISVKLGDAGIQCAPRDTYCVVQLQLRGAPAATVVALGADAYDTIDRAADRIGNLAEAQLRSADARRRRAPALRRTGRLDREGPAT